jgi:hypothetical protein
LLFYNIPANRSATPGMTRPEKINPIEASSVINASGMPIMGTKITIFHLLCIDKSIITQSDTLRDAYTT